MAYLCYRCYMKRTKEDHWDQFNYAEGLRNICEDCRLFGLFVREIKEEINHVEMPCMENV